MCAYILNQVLPYNISHDITPRASKVATLTQSKQFPLSYITIYALCLITGWEHSHSSICYNAHIYIYGQLLKMHNFHMAQ